MTCKEIIIDYLKINCNNILISHHLLDILLPDYGFSKFGKRYSSSTYHRIFCWLKNEPETLSKNGIELKPVKIRGEHYNSWRVIRKPQIEMESK